MIALKKLECIFKEIILKECKTAAVISKIKKITDQRSKSTAISKIKDQRVPPYQPSQRGFPILCILLWSGIATPPPPLAAGIGNPGRRLPDWYNGPVGHVTSGHVTWEGASNAEVYELSRRREGIGNESAWSVRAQI